MTDTASSKSNATKKKNYDFGDVDRQLAGLVVSPSATKYSKQGAVSFRLSIPYGSPEGYSPVCWVRGGRLGRFGSSEDPSFGFAVRQVSGSASWVKFHVGLDNNSCPGLAKIIKGFMDTFLKTYLIIDGQPADALNRVRYQKNFAELNDGTKVDQATQHLRDPARFVDLSLPVEGTDYFTFDSPARTFAPYVYGEDNSTYYLEATVPSDEDDESAVFCFTAEDKTFESQVKGGVTVYPETGIRLTHTDALDVFSKSDFFRKKTWAVTFALRVSSMEFLCRKRGEWPGTGNPLYAVYPVFKYRTVGGIKLQEVKREGDGELHSDAQCAALANSFMFKPPPAKRARKRKAPASKGEEKDSVSVTEVNGEDTE